MIVLLSLISVIGILIFLYSFVTVIPIHPENIMQQIYVELTSGHAIGGLLLFAVSAGAAGIMEEVRRSTRAASSERQTIGEALRRISRHTEPGAEQIPVLNPGPRPITEWRGPLGLTPVE